MKRSSLLFFALVLLPLFFAPEAFAATTFSAVNLSLSPGDLDGYGNFNDNIIVTVIATHTGTNWIVPPQVDLTSLGLGTLQLPSVDSIAWRYERSIQLASWKALLHPDPGIANSQATVIIRAMASDEVAVQATTSNPLNFDLVQPSGTNPRVSPALINKLGVLTVSITDANFQALPSKTVAYADLTPLGGPADFPIPHIESTDNFSATLNSTANTFLNNTEFSGSIKIFLKDPLNPSVNYDSNSFEVDTKAPVISAATAVAISGNNPVLSGDILRLTLTVDNYDNDTASVTIAGLTAAAATPDDAIVTGLAMPLVSSVAGGQAVWIADVELASTTIKNNAMTVVFAATDNAGNITTVNRTFAIDLDVPAINPLTVKCLGQGQEERNDPYDKIATAACWLKFDANVPINVGPDILTVTINLSPIGGDPAVVMDNPSGSDYTCRYQIPPGSIEDSVIQTFQVTARDTAGNTVYKTTTPPIRIDNSMPAISSAVLSSPDGKITVGSTYTITVTATGVETGTVTVDLSQIGSGTNQVLKPVPSTPNTYSETFILPNSRVSGKARDGLTGFPVVVSDIVASGSLRVPGHYVYGTTTQMTIDNEPPVLIEVATFTVDAPKNGDYVIIGDSVRLEVNLASTTGTTKFDGQRVFADLSSAGLPASQELTLSSGLYTYTFTVATGPLNLGATFPISIADDDGNKAVLGLTSFSNHTASVTIRLFDQNPPDPGIPTLTVTRKPGQIVDSDDNPTLINTHKELFFRLPFTRETIDDHATAAVSLRLVPSVGKEYLTPDLQLTSSSDLVKFSNSDTASYSLRLDVASFTEADKDRFEYPTAFTVYMYDRSGNVVVTTTNPAIKYRADCFPPAIASLSATPANGNPALIGDQIHFRVKTLHNIDEYDGNNRISPVIDLTNLGYSNAEVMNPDPLDADWYEYFATVRAGTINGTNATWTITLRDGGRNFVSSYTPPILVDNQGPIIAYASASWTGMPGPMKLGIAASFTVKINEPVLGNATIDLSPIGGGTAVTMTGSNASYSILTTTAQTNAEFSNYRFKITISDQYGNSAITETNQVQKIDCQPPVFESHGIAIFETNGDNPQPTAVSNLNDVIVVFASISAALDATPVATIGSSTGSIATATMLFNAGRNRHEAFFTVASSSTRWGEMNGTMTYHISCPDDVLNPAIPSAVTGESTFKVKNQKPSIAGLNMWLNPNNERQSIGTYQVLNVASGAPADLLLASATLANGAVVTSAFIDLSAIPGAPARLAMTEITGSVASTPVGIDLSSYAKIDYSSLTTFWVILYDEAGNSATASKTFYVDTKRPAITKAEFNGTTISVSFSEEIATPSPALWRLVGSATAQAGTTASMSLGDFSLATPIPFFESYDFDLKIDGRKIVAGWASTPLYLEIIASDVAAISDKYGNWLPPAHRYPLTITNSSFRESAKISSIYLNHYWPNQTKLQITFDRAMEAYAASAAVLFVDPPASTNPNPFIQVNYNLAYYFNVASDSFNWNGDKTVLNITLCDEGTDWVAKKLGNGAKTIKFVQRESNKPFARDDLGKAMTFYSYSNPVIITDNRSSSDFDWTVDGNPKIDLSQATLDITFTDRAWLFTNDYATWNPSPEPEVFSPAPTDSQGNNAFQGKIYFYDRTSLANKKLNFEKISSVINYGCSSTTVRLKLTTEDINNIISLYNLSEDRIWGLKIDGGAFSNLWGVGNTAYLDPDPGIVQLTVATPVASVAAPVCAVSDMPPTREDTGNFIFEFEMVPATSAAGIVIPFSTAASPTAGIFLQSDGSRLASGTFIGWSYRTVNGVSKTIAAFKTSEDFRTDVDYGTPAQLEIFGLKDIFDNPVTGMIASFVYDRASRTTAGSGFTTASAALVVDNVLPTVVSILPGDVIGVTNANTGLFKINFSEPMDTTAAKRPGLSLATDTETINFVFSHWENNNQRAVYKNLQAITLSTPNGTWTYTISGGADAAGNSLVTETREVRILSDAPPVAPGGVALKTIQSTISPAELLNQPLSFAVTPTAELSITYQKIPTENLPHMVRFYNSNDLMIGSAIVVIGPDTAATATIDSSNFVPALGNVGPLPITVKLVDNAGNLTGGLLEVTYDANAPVLNSFELTGVATRSLGIYYYNSLNLGNLTAIAGSAATDPLRLTIASEAVLATATLDMTRSSNYSVSFGRSVPPTLAPGTYSLRVTDAAGNMHTGSGSITLRVDNASPTVTAIEPSTVIGITAARMATFTVTFSERMDNMASPTLELATSSRIIPMDFVGWADATVATTAYFVNRFDIDFLHPAGVYNYRITNPGTVRDLAANPLNPAGNFSLDVQSKGPAAPVTVLSLQPDIFGSSVLENSHYSTLVDPSGSASVRLDYSSQPPLNWPHQLLVYSPDKTLVATLAIDATSYIAEFPGNSASWANLSGPDADGHYSFKLIDNLGNIGPETGYLNRTLYLDRASATVETLTFNDGGFGIASAGIRYFSPILNGSATVTLTTLATDSIRLVVASGTATHTFDLASATTTHTGLVGGTLPEGLYTVSTADFAGNFSIGATSTFQLMVDFNEPIVISASPDTTIGAVAANGGNFQVIFSERMQTAGTPPTAYLASTTPLSKEAPLKFVSWSDDYTANFVAEKAIDDSFAPGTYSYIIAGARDYAGNIATSTVHGAFTVQIYSKKPVFNATLTTRQPLISGNTDLIDTLVAYFSPNVAPGVATLTVTYSDGPYSTPHQLMLYDATNVHVRTINLTASGSTGIASVDAAFFNNPDPNSSPILHRFTVLDSLGNYSATSTLNLVYDAIGPDVSSLVITNVSPASINPVYYHNPALHGNLVVAAETNDASGPARLLLGNGVATKTWQMTSLTGDSRYSYSMTAADNNATAMPDGTYGMTLVDGAGNFATGVASTAVLVIDRVAPLLTSTQLSAGTYLSSGAAGAATFTLTFDEELYALATPTLSIATTSASITCVCASFSGKIATFTTAMAVTNALPQGEYTWKIRATDLTGNVFDGASGTVMVRSRGPVIASIRTESMQATTASGSETLINQPFSFMVNPGVSTLSVQLGGAPDGNPNLVHLHYMLEGNVIASYPLPLVGNAATFSWSIAQGPQPTLPTTYNMFLVDTNGDYSLEQLPWRLDNATPTVTGLSLTGGENDAANSTIYFNPFRHPFINTKFQAPAETEAPKLRIRGLNSTDTYELSPAGTGFWSTNFTGVYSRSTQAATRLPDGRYDVGMVDRAGNLAASASENLYTLIIDTQNPVVSTYTMYVASQPVSWFAPSAGNLDIFAVTAEPLSATAAFYIEIANVVGARINRLPLVASAGALLATWNGRNDLGNLVADGDYTFRVSDYAGNLATASTKLRVIASDFKASSVTQISSTSARIWFNQELKSSTINSASLQASPSLTFNSVTVDEPMAILFTTSQKFAHNQIYQISVASGTSGVRSIYGASLSSATNQIAFTADGEGPGIVSHDFSGLTSQKEFKIVFNETLDSSKAGNITAYSLKNSTGGSIALTQAALQTDQITVKLTAAEDLVESQNYTITASGVTDIFGNAGTGLPHTFQGRDLTPPVIKVSAFSNPANVNDIIVLASTNEPLKSAPVLYVRHGSASTVSIGMQARTGNQLFMAGVSLNSANGSTGTLTVRGEDVSGNQGAGEGSFTIAYVAANIAAQILSADENLKLTFAEDSLKEDTTIKILKHELSHDASENGLIMASMQKELRTIRGLRASVATGREVQNSSELIPVSAGYEISVDARKISKGFGMAFKLPATATTGLGLFNQSGSSWKFITAGTIENAFSARLTSSQIIAVMRDISAPRISLDQDIDLTEPLRSARPEFKGQIEEYGSGLNQAETLVSINGGVPQPVAVDATGRFTFKPLAPLANGEHELVIRATDQTGNMAQTAAIRFQVALPLQIDQIMQYPNPARNRGFIRISANSGSLTDDLVKIRIYDTAGHKVAALGNVRAVKENFAAGGSRYLYDIAWDLRNEDGKTVANGVYIARIEVLDPLNPAIKVKKTCKLAVLR